MTACPPCVGCELDWAPIDPAWLAERQAAEREGRETVDRLLAAIPVYVPGPPSTVASVAPAPVSARDRGRSRREAIDAIPDTAPAFGSVGIVLSDRRSLRIGRRGSRTVRKEARA